MSVHIFIATCIILIESTSDHSYSSQAMLICGTLTGYMIINICLLIGILLDGAVMDKRVIILFNFAAIVLFVASGSVIIQQWTDNYPLPKDKNLLNVAGTIAIINGFIYLVELFIILKQSY
ncbi:uncharacterized protein LOC142228934 [Haematobia irritans]|uniref:uncharacterized protein LOC142228934 n=1 Tax=Haematobia irritans TaxID=7368 RepID=UPI003F4F6AD3